MRDDGDFTAYAEARWPALVRTAVWLGAPTVLAADLAEGALARCRLDWRAIRDAEDIDVEVYAELLEERARVLAETGPSAAAETRSEASPVAPRPAAPDGDRSDAALLLEALLDALDRLDPAHRGAVVLRHGAGLSTDQVAAVLEVDPSEVERRLTWARTVLDPERLVQRCR